MMAASQSIELAGLSTTIVGDAQPRGNRVVVLLHGYDMTPADLAPFGASLKVPATFLFPQGPVAVAHSAATRGGCAWWNIDEERRRHAMQRGPRDLAEESPPGLVRARDALGAFLREVVAQYAPRELVLGGFSQGGMLACDWALHGDIPIQALILMSASRLDFPSWQTRRQRLHGLPAFICHGTLDDDLSFAAGERLHDFLDQAGASVKWVPFDGGHEIPLVVWRALRTFLGELSKSADNLTFGR